MKVFVLCVFMVLAVGCARMAGPGSPEPPTLLAGGPVQLTVSTGEEITNPSDKQLRRALSALDVERDGEGFAILARSNMTYLQISGDREIGFDMEFQEADVDHHYRAQRTNIPLDEVVGDLAAYRDGELGWWRSKQWDHYTW